MGYRLWVSAAILGASLVLSGIRCTYSGGFGDRDGAPVAVKPTEEVRRVKFADVEKTGYDGFLLTLHNAFLANEECDIVFDDSDVNRLKSFFPIRDYRGRGRIDRVSVRHDKTDFYSTSGTGNFVVQGVPGYDGLLVGCTRTLGFEVRRDGERVVFSRVVGEMKTKFEKGVNVELTLGALRLVTGDPEFDPRIDINRFVTGPFGGRERVVLILDRKARRYAGFDLKVGGDIDVTQSERLTYQD